MQTPPETEDRAGAPELNAEPSEPATPAPDPCDELEALESALRSLQSLRVVEYMLRGRWLRVRVLDTGRHVTAKRLGINWLVWVDDAEMGRFKGGQLHTAFMAGVEKAAAAGMR